MFKINVRGTMGTASHENFSADIRTRHQSQGLFEDEGYEHSLPVKYKAINNGETIPENLGKSQEDQIRDFLGALSVAQAQILEDTASHMVTTIRAALACGNASSVVSSLSSYATDAVQNTLAHTAGIDEQALQNSILSVMTLGMDEVQEHLVGLAASVQQANSAKKDIRETLTELRNALADPNSAWPQTFSWHEYTIDSNSGEISVTQRTQNLTQAQAKALLAKLDGQLSTIGDNAQVLHLNLQDALQKHAEITNIFTAILKSMHETMIGTIRNLKA